MFTYTRFKYDSNKEVPRLRRTCTVQALFDQTVGSNFDLGPEYQRGAYIISIRIRGHVD